MSQFKWTRNRECAALALAQGDTIAEAAEKSGVTSRTINRWKNNIEFMAEVDRLSHMVSVASRAERLRIAMRVVRQRMKGEQIETDKDVLDWLKYAQSETDGAKLDLTALYEAATQMAES